MVEIVKIEKNNLEQYFEFGKVAKQCSGSVLYKCGKSVLLATVAADLDNTVDEDFLPLTVQYIEKSYSAGKIPGGFIKREAKPSDFETLTSRIVDRSIRPLFPKGYAHPTQVTILVLSVESDADLQVMALSAAQAALYASDIPLDIPVGAVRIGKIDGEFVVNPKRSELAKSSLDLFVSGTYNDLLMIEMRSLGKDEMISSPIDNALAMDGMVGEMVSVHRANEMSEQELLEALSLAQSAINEISSEYAERFAKAKKPHAKVTLKESIENQALYDNLKKDFLPQIQSAIKSMAKSERESELKAIAKEASAKYESDKAETTNTLKKIKKELVRAMILDERVRADGRGLKEVRPISIETNILPSTHGSTLFTRGQTQALVVATLGGDMDAQSYELITEKTNAKEKFMVHYNFPGFSVGEANMIGAPGRRELGHGNLAKRAIEPTIINPDGKTIRLVSEILESNGSSSMATVCGGSLALRAADIEVTSLVAGVAMGLVVEGDKYGVLTDIMGLEDHDGDMDFKVAGTREGITAMQMDIKLGGLDFAILKEALHQAKEGREHILNIMEKAESEIVINESILPSTNIFNVHPSKIVDIIGQAGKTIKEIIERFGVSIDLDREKGEVKVSGGDKGKVTEASDHIIEITNKPSERGGHGRDRGDRGERAPNPADVYNVGDKFSGKVKKIVEFGAFIELPKGGDGLLHISKLSDKRVNKVSDVLSEGQEVEAEILSINKNKVELGLVNNSKENVES